MKHPSSTNVRKQGHQISVIIDPNCEENKHNTQSASSAYTKNNKSQNISELRKSIDSVMMQTDT
jgi:hypothetical protein